MDGWMIGELIATGLADAYGGWNRDFILSQEMRGDDQRI
jgi:hypothetical protein